MHSIQEDDAGVIWFGMQDGVSSYDGSKITYHTKAVVGKGLGDLRNLGPGVLQGQWVKAATYLWFKAGTKEGVSGTMVNK